MSYAIIWNKPILCILCCINTYSKDFSKKKILAILWPSHYWKMAVFFSKAFFQKAISRLIFVRFWKTWYHYDRKSEIFNLSTLTPCLEFYLKNIFLWWIYLSRPKNNEYNLRIQKHLQKLGQQLLVIGQF